MITGHFFKHIRDRESANTDLLPPSEVAFVAFLSKHVGDRFARVSGLDVLALPLAPSTIENAEDPPWPAVHPACAEFAQSDYCRESWQLHRAELKDRPQSHWHTCDYGVLCAVVPVVCRGRCAAAFQLACQNSMAEDSFAEHVEVLDALVRDFAAHQHDLLSRLLPAERGSEGHDVPAPHRTERPTEAQPNHPKVLRAMEYIEAHLSDPKLTVGHIARELDIHPDYLANLFAAQVGQRMSRYIAGRRLERAKNLLATTSWQIKQVAHKSGFAHPNWFYHVFHSHTGVTPTEYRQTARAQQARPLRIA